jgi:uncharacterized protein
MRDGRLRRVVKAFARMRFAIDAAVDRAIRRRRAPWFDLGGECRRCARCCEAPAIAVNAFVWHVPTLRASFLWWQRVVNGFELVETRRPTRSFVFRCSHFDWTTRACDSYESRPGMCRDYPRALLYQPEPELLEGCGYRPVLPRASRFLRVLDEQALSSDQKDSLRRGLHLE